MNVLEINNLTKKFGDFIAVDNMSLSVQRGKYLVFWAPMELGKARRLTWLLGLLRSKWEMSILGKNMLNTAALRK